MTASADRCLRGSDRLLMVDGASKWIPQKNDSSPMLRSLILLIQSNANGSRQRGQRRAISLPLFFSSWLSDLPVGIFCSVCPLTVGVRDNQPAAGDHANERTLADHWMSWNAFFYRLCLTSAVDFLLIRCYLFIFIQLVGVSTVGMQRILVRIREYNLIQCRIRNDDDAPVNFIRAY